jgi:hypothetical protein
MTAAYSSKAGGWDPPICERVDAAVNFDAELDEMDQAT